MEQRKNFFRSSILFASFGALMALAVACGDDDDNSPTPGSGGTKNTAGTSSNNPGGENTGATTNTGGKSNTDGTSTNMGGNSESAGGAGAGPGPTNEAGNTGEGGACTDDADQGCYKCAPKTHDQFLNACPTTGCEPFDNGKLTSIKNGKLPALP
jgi:hypothetical protein